MLSVGFLGTRGPEDLVGLEVMCQMPCAAKSGFFSFFFEAQGPSLPQNTEGVL
jgi:hypothetical protein